MYVHRGKRLCYLAHPRTASIATRRALVWGCGFEQEAGHHGGPNDDAAETEFDDSWTFFTTVREHRDAIASWSFQSDRLELTPEGFRDWARTEGVDYVDRHPKGGYRLYWWTDLADVILRYERLEEELSDLLERFGCTGWTLEHRNVSEDRDGSALDVLGASMYRWIEHAFHHERLDLGYT